MLPPPHNTAWTVEQQLGAAGLWEWGAKWAKQGLEAGGKLHTQYNTTYTHTAKYNTH